MDRELEEGRFVAFVTVLYAASLAAALATVALYLFFEGILLSLGVVEDLDGHAARVLAAASLFDLVAVFGGLAMWLVALRFDFSLGGMIMVKSSAAAVCLIMIPTWFLAQAFPGFETTFVLTAGAVVASLNLAGGLLNQLEVTPAAFRRTMVASGIFLVAGVAGGLLSSRALSPIGAETGLTVVALLVANLLLIGAAAAAAYHGLTMWREIWRPLDREVRRAAARARTLAEPAWH